MKKALITGITGQDGAYLAEFLLNNGYEVHGIKRRSSLFNTQRIDHIYEDPHIPDRHLHLHYGDLSDSTNIIRIIQEVQPDEIYNLGAMSGSYSSLINYLRISLLLDIFSITTCFIFPFLQFTEIIIYKQQVYSALIFLFVYTWVSNIRFSSIFIKLLIDPK